MILNAEKFINKQLFNKRIHEVTKNIRENLETHPLRTGLLNAELRQYQLDGIAFEFLGAAVSKNEEMNSSPMAESIFNEFTKSADKDDNGKYNLNFSLDEDALKNLAGTLAAIMQGAK